MFVMAVMTVLCTAGVTFCLRFMSALLKERKPRVVGYLVIQPAASSESRTAELGQWKKPATRAA
jgi:hypothetical protein